MKASKIESILSEDQDAVFCLMPGTGLTTFVQVRGLTRASAGTWKFTKVRRAGGDWLDRGGLLLSRDIVTREQATAECTRRIDEAEASLNRRTDVDDAIERLARVGVQAHRSARGLEIRDMVALGELLERIG